MKQQIKHHAIITVAVLAVLAIGAGAFVYSGVYNIGADDHHAKPVFSVLQTLRQRSIEVRSRDIVVPDLSDPELMLEGAGHYAAMCTGCHLKPGMVDSEIRPGLYPQPPNLSQVRVDPREAFWVIKHGIKMSGMPAWGFNHDDSTIWSMVAFLQKLPDMTADQYKDIVAKAPADHDMDGGHSHGDAHDSADMDGGHMSEVEDIRRLQAERPDACGLAAPGMPVGSPGMEAGEPERYDLMPILYDGSTRICASHGPRT